jgi:hypothetical protein
MSSVKGSSNRDWAGFSFLEANPDGTPRKTTHHYSCCCLAGDHDPCIAAPALCADLDCPCLYEGTELWQAVKGPHLDWLFVPTAQPQPLSTRARPTGS